MRDPLRLRLRRAWRTERPPIQLARLDWLDNVLWLRRLVWIMDGGIIC